MPDILKWVSKDNLITFWNEIRENLAGVVVEEVNEILGPTVEPMIDAAKDAVLGNLSTVESSDQASQNYSEGAYLVHNKNFYKVTSAIASGDTLEEGTNIEQTTVGEEMAENKIQDKEIPFTWTPPGVNQSVFLTIPHGIPTTNRILSVSASTGSTNAYVLIRMYDALNIIIRVVQYDGMSESSVTGKLSIIYI